MKLNPSSLSLALFLGCTAFATPVLSQTATDTAMPEQGDSAQERIDYTGKLRMLSQRIPAAACHLSGNIDPEGSLETLNAATAEFDRILNALEFGDAELGIYGAEERRKTVAEIQELRTAWEPLRTAAAAISNGESSDEHLQAVIGQNMQVLSAAQSLVTTIVGDYSNPADLVQADSFLIDIAGRQRMLTQMISKDSCFVTTGKGSAETVESLQGSMQAFSTSLEALRHGMPSAGIRRPPTAEISEGLDNVLEEWVVVTPLLETIVNGETLGTEESARKAQALDIVMITMNDVVGMYAKATK